MYILFKNEGAQVELVIPEEAFLNKVNGNFLKMINFFRKRELAADDYKMHPMTKMEAEWMIYAYCKLSELNRPLPKWLRHYFHVTFSHLLKGDAPARALGLTNPPHRPKESYVAERNQQIYLDVSGLMQQGKTLFDAALEISEKYNLHESNIQKIYSVLKKINRPKSPSVTNVENLGVEEDDFIRGLREFDPNLVVMPT